jgi:hypothetical protein
VGRIGGFHSEEARQRDFIHGRALRLGLGAVTSNLDPPPCAKDVSRETMVEALLQRVPLPAPDLASGDATLLATVAWRSAIVGWL